MERVKSKAKRLRIPRKVAIIATKLGIRFQPNRGSSLYRLPGKKKIFSSQKNWMSPVGTLRVSDHWGYENSDGNIVYRSDIPVTGWAIGINDGIGPNPWKIILKFDEMSVSEFNYESIESEIRKHVWWIRF